ncbi:hypothetical protein [Jatrophihabitans lederbergiae]|uniref:Antitoxin n=1 Tax=Jatrophihabitans lederbergiae TaxID=3075547 RepID=A0ABU2JCI2_9ACTN|nr:hypothetical protein [Jatrophihabitans sp. DSM 44399]MDT0262438.1 hypothetical protein [Jatrophihabitans sp. DSM 44399]
MATARAKAKALVEAAQAEGDALITAAQAGASKADEAYAEAWNASKDAGWAPAQLRAMGYAKPPVGRRPAPGGAGASVVKDATGSSSSNVDDGERNVDVA